MAEGILVNAFNSVKRKFEPGMLMLGGDLALDVRGRKGKAAELYISPGFIDSHAHVYPGVTDLGICADDIGLAHGVHLIIDAGSAGAVTLPCFRDVLAPRLETEVKALLNISRIGLVTKQPYVDDRVTDVEAAVRAVQEDAGRFVIGLKVNSSGTIVEAAGLTPISRVMDAAEKTGTFVMAHMVEGPPSNEDNMAFMREGDIITHIFHGRFNYAAHCRASRGKAFSNEFYTMDNIMWNPDGTPVPPLERALARGVLLDVGHGAASFDREVAKSVISTGFKNFSISTDAHIRNINGAVRGMPETMSKFLALGMTLDDVVAGVTVIPAGNLRIKDWCLPLEKRSTLFRVRDALPDGEALVDSYGQEVEAKKRIEPVAVIINGTVRSIAEDWKTETVTI